jgi:hypothetical protein
MSFQEFLKKHAAQIAAEEESAIKAVFSEWSDLNTEANVEMVVRSLRRKNSPINVETLQNAITELYFQGRVAAMSLEEREAYEQRQAERAEEDQKIERVALLRELVRRLKVKGLTQRQINSELNARYRFWSNSELRTHLERADEAKRLRNLSPVELRREIRKQHPPAGTPVLPAEYTAESLKKLARDNTPAFKALVRQYGAQVNERMGVIKQPLPGVTVTN